MEKLTLLHIEDNIGDAILVKEYLSLITETDFSITHCELLQDGVRSLEQQNFDVVLLDLGLPDSQGINGVKKLMNTFPDLCLVVATGNRDQVLGTAAMKHGAQDYLSKDAIDSESLQKAILFSYERKSAEKTLKKQKAELTKLKTAVEQSANSVVITDLKDTIEYVNPKFTEVSGYSREEVIGQHTSILKSGKHDRDFYSEMWQTISEGNHWAGELVNRKKNGELFWESATIDPVRNENGQVVNYIAIKEEITERKAAQERLQQNERNMRFLANAASDLLKINTTDQLFDYIAKQSYEAVNKKGLVLINQYSSDQQYYTVKSYEGANKQVKMALDLLGKPIKGMTGIVVPQLREQIEDRKMHQFPLDIPTLTHNKIGKKLADQLISALGIKSIHIIGFKKFDQIFGSIVIINPETKLDLDYSIFESFIKLVSLFLEKQEALDNLIENEKRFKQVADTAEDWIWEIDNRGVFTYSSPAVTNLLGYRPEELIGNKHYYDLYDDSLGVAIHKQVAAIIRQNESFKNLINIHEHKNGQQVWLRSSGGPILDEYGEVKGYRGTDSDITLIVKTREQFKEIIEFAPSAIFVHDYEGNILMTNQQAVHSLGYTQKEMLGMTVFDIGTQYKNKNQADKEWRMVAHNKSHTFESSYRKKNGKEVPVEVSLSQVIFENQKRMLAFVKDISERKEAEQQIRRNSALLLEAHKTAKVGSWVWDIAKDEVRWSQGLYAILDLPYADEVKSPEDFMQFIHPDEPGRKSRKGSFLGKVAEESREFRIVSASGKVKYMYSKISSYTERAGIVFGILQDVTELKENERKLEEAQRIARIGSWKFNLETQTYTLSKEALNILEQGQEFELTLASMLSIIHPEDKPILHQELSGVLSGKKIDYSEVEFRVQVNGKVKWLLARSHALKNPSGNVTHTTGIVQDITERKEPQVLLERSEKHLRKAFEIAVMGRFTYEPKLDKFHWSEKSKDIMGITDQRPVRNMKEFQSLLFHEDRGRILDAVNRTMENHEKFQMDHRILTDSGDVKWVRVQTEYEYDSTGKVILSDGIIRDIHEEKINEIRMEEANRQLNNIIRSVPGIVFHCYLDEDYTMRFLSDQCEQITGYTTAEIYEKNPPFASLISERDQDRVRRSLLEAGPLGEYEIKYRITTKDGEEKWVWESGSVRPSEHKDEPLVLEGIITDITDVVNTEEKILTATLRGEDDERRRIAKDIHDGVQQTLISAMLSLQALESEMDKINPKKAGHYHTGMTSLKVGIEETRSIAHSIMPKSIQDFGLIKTLESLASLINETRDLNVYLYENLGNSRLDTIIETSLYRICQEAMNNIFKYAEATEVTIQVMKYDDCILFSVEDNGKGFDVNEADILETGLGISSMRSRASAISGTLDISSRKDHGTNILVEIPIGAEQAVETKLK